LDRCFSPSLTLESRLVNVTRVRGRGEYCDVPSGKGRKEARVGNVGASDRCTAPAVVLAAWVLAALAAHDGSATLDELTDAVREPGAPSTVC
jgi:hypothetical protein